MTYAVGVDGGGTKTECILVDPSGQIVQSSVGPGCNPSIVGAAEAHAILLGALQTLREKFSASFPARATFSSPAALEITATLLCMAGSPGFWQDFSATLTGFGRVVAVDDSRPTLELATHGRPGLVVHAGTGSFVAALGPDGAVHYAGGIGWRFGDSGSGYELGRRAIARALLDLQGWLPAPKLAAVVQQATGLTDAAALTRYYYSDPSPNQKIAALTPALLHLASAGDPSAQQLVVDCTGELLDFAAAVARKLFAPAELKALPVGLSGPILTHPAVLPALVARSPLTLTPILRAPIEGVRQMLAHGRF